jgi:3-oxoacyl-[acyl-carrier-protein] synthase-3
MQQLPGSLIDIAYYLPEQVVNNDTFGETFPAWKVESTALRTGVLKRHIAHRHETAYDLALAAATRLLAKHPTLKAKVDAILFCTQSPDYVMPSNAFLLQRDLGISKHILALDYTLACSGFVYGLVMATSFIRSGVAKHILLVTADTYSKYLQDNDRSTRMLFGDGAAVSWVGIKEDSSTGAKPLITSFLDFMLASDGEGWDQFLIRSGGSRQPPSCRAEPDYNDKITMNGLGVLNFVNDRVIGQLRTLLSNNHLTAGDIDQFFFHQASALALSSLGKQLKISDKQMFSNLATVGNTVSASIPILIKDYYSHHTLPPNSLVVVSGFGVGYSWGSILAST